MDACLRFVKRTTQKDYVYIYSGQGWVLIHVYDLLKEQPRKITCTFIEVKGECRWILSHHKLVNDGTFSNIYGLLHVSWTIVGFNRSHLEMVSPNSTRLLLFALLMCPLKWSYSLEIQCYKEEPHLKTKAVTHPAISSFIYGGELTFNERNFQHFSLYYRS